MSTVKEPSVGAPSAPPLGWTTKILFGAGAAANGINQRGLTAFLMIFYNQVAGLPPAMIGAAIMATLVFDAIVDPVVGQLSDNFRSPIGRRHPFMYTGAVPFALAYFLIWNPPLDWSDEAIFAYLLVCLLAIRLFDTFFELPSAALVPELAPGYTERTSLLAIRRAFDVLGGLGMTVLALQVFMKENREGAGGMIDREGYFSYSAVAAGLILLTVLISAAATHRYIPYLKKIEARRVTARGMIKEIAATLRNRMFAVLVLSVMFAAVGVGLKWSLEMYFRVYFWNLAQSQVAVLIAIGTISGVVGASLAPAIGNWMGKRNGAMLVFSIAAIAAVIPIFMRLAGVAPQNGTTELFALLIAEAVVNNAMAMAAAVLLDSMFADVVEDAEVRTGRRSEGLLLSANNFLRKAVSGLGVFLSGVILAWVGFPANAERGQVTPEVLQNLGLTAVPTALALGFAAILTLWWFNGTRSSHEKNLRVIKERAVKAGGRPDRCGCE